MGRPNPLRGKHKWFQLTSLNNFFMKDFILRVYIDSPWGAAMHVIRSGAQATLLGVFGWVFAVTPVFGEEACRDIHAVACAPAKPRGQVVLEGEYWGLLIGINNYQFQPKLKTAVQDATAVREVLSQRYGFKSDHLQMLTDENATRDNILHALDVLQQQAGDKDSVFIYYAGHGETNTDKTRGWWIPVEGKSKGSFISNEDLRAELADIKARHVYVVADSCFSGTFLRPDPRPQKRS